MVEQTRRHAAVAALLGVPHLLLAVNKIDLVDYSEQVFAAIADRVLRYARRLGVHEITASRSPRRRRQRGGPVDADRLVRRAERARATWRPSDSHAADGFAELRFPVQYVIRPQTAELAPWASRTPDLTADYRGYAGQIAAGRVRVGDEVVVLPRGSHTTVIGIDTPDGALDLAVAGQSVILRLAGDIDVSRGDLIASTDAPPAPVREVAATVSWLADRELTVGARVLVQHGTSLTKG